MKVKIQVSCKYTVKKTAELPEEIVAKLKERCLHTGTVGADGELAEYLGEVIHEADAEDWEYEVYSIDKVE